MRYIRVWAVVTVLMILACSYASGQSFIGRWVNLRNTRDRIHIEKDGQAIVIRVLDYKRTLYSMPAEYSQGALYATRLLRMSFRIESKSGLLISDLGNYRRLTPELEQKLDKQVETELRAAADRQRLQREEENRGRLVAERRAELKSAAYQMQETVVKVGDRDGFDRYIRKYPDLLKPFNDFGNRYCWIAVAMYSKEMPESVKREFVQFMAKRGCDFQESWGSVRNEQPSTLVHAFAAHGAYETGYSTDEAISILVAAGANVNALDFNGATPLDLVQQRLKDFTANPDEVRALTERLRALGAKMAAELQPVEEVSSDYGLVPVGTKKGFRLKDYSGSVLLVGFYVGDSQEADASALTTKYGGLGLRAVVVVKAATLADTQSRQRDAKPATIPIYWDRDNKMRNTCRVTDDRPTYVVFNRSGDRVGAVEVGNNGLQALLVKAGLWKR